MLKLKINKRLSNKKRAKNVFLFVITGFVLTYAMITNAYEYPLKVSENKRYLVDQKNEPVFWSGEAAWSLIVQLSREDVVYYLQDREKKGFNVLLINLIDHAFCNNPPANFYGDLPFTGNVFKTPNEAYFQHVDFVIHEAAKRDMIILLCPLYLGYNCGYQGWCTDVKRASLSDMRTWGQYIGDRYKKYDNIIWCIGGDTDPTPVRKKILQCVEGIREKDTRHLFTSHNQSGSFGIDPWDDEAWLTINNVYSYETRLYIECETAYKHTPVLPYFLIESTYENEHNASQMRIRAQAYWTILSGGFGNIFGNCPVWHFGANQDWCGTTEWKLQLDSSGSISMMNLQRLFRSRAWHLLTPDFNHTVLKEANNFWDELKSIFQQEQQKHSIVSYPIAAITKNGNTIIGYTPINEAIKIDISALSGDYASCWWYNPRDASAISIGQFPATGVRAFVPPSEGDWVIVIDDASKKNKPPGYIEGKPVEQEK